MDGREGHVQVVWLVATRPSPEVEDLDPAEIAPEEDVLRDVRKLGHSGPATWRQRSRRTDDRPVGRASTRVDDVPAETGPCMARRRLRVRRRHGASHQ